MLHPYFEQFLPKTPGPASLPGSLHARYVRCGKPRCRCAGGDLHGPYFRHVWREDGRTVRRYVRAVDAPLVAAACAQYARLHPSQRAFQRTIREFSRASDEVIAVLDGLRAHGRD